MSANDTPKKSRKAAKIARIREAIRKAGYPTLDALAREIGVSRPAVSSTLNGGMKSERIASRIAEIAGSTPAKLWPRLYPNLPHAS